MDSKKLELKITAFLKSTAIDNPPSLAGLALALGEPLGPLQEAHPQAMTTVRNKMIHTLETYALSRAVDRQVALALIAEIKNMSVWEGMFRV